jgi:hypothetical protein
MKYNISALYNNVEFLEKILNDKPNARIVHILSHDQRRGFHLIVEEDGSQYLDDFGLEVYIAQEIDWQGNMADIDERFEGALPF